MTFEQRIPGNDAFPINNEVTTGQSPRDVVRRNDGLRQTVSATVRGAVDGPRALTEALPADRLERGLKRVNEDIDDALDPTLSRLFGNEEEFEKQLRAHIADPRLQEPTFFRDMLRRACTFLHRDRAVKFADRSDSEGVHHEEAAQTIAELAVRAMQTQGAWLTDILNRHKLWDDTTIPREGCES